MNVKTIRNDLPSKAIRIAYHEEFLCTIIRYIDNNCSESQLSINAIKEGLLGTIGSLDFKGMLNNDDFTKTRISL